MKSLPFADVIPFPGRLTAFRFVNWVRPCGTRVTEGWEEMAIASIGIAGEMTLTRLVTSVSVIVPFMFLLESPQATVK